MQERKTLTSVHKSVRIYTVMNHEGPRAANRYPHTPEEELVGLVMSKKIAASSIDENVNLQRAAEGKEGWALEHRPYVIPRQRGGLLPCDCDQMRFEPRQGRGFGVQEIFAWIPRADESEPVFFNDIFFKVIYGDGHPEEHYLLNSQEFTLYQQPADIVDHMEELEGTGYLLTGDRYSVGELGRAGRLTPVELLIILDPAIALTQDPASEE